MDEVSSRMENGHVDDLKLCKGRTGKPLALDAAMQLSMRSTDVHRPYVAYHRKDPLILVNARPMKDHAISTDVRRWLRDYIDTFTELEILVRLAADCAQPWSEAKLVGDLQQPTSAVREALTHLRGTRLIDADTSTAIPLYTCRNDTPQLPVVKRLVDMCSTHRLEVMNVLTANALDRVRTSTMDAFVRAFQALKRGE